MFPNDDRKIILRGGRGRRTSTQARGPKPASSAKKYYEMAESTKKVSLSKVSKTFSNFLANERNKRKLNRAELAKNLQIPKAELEKYENGTAKEDKKLEKRIREYFARTPVPDVNDSDSD